MIGETMAIALILIYSFVIVAHLYFCYFGNEPLRKITKLLLMPLLLTVYCIATESIALGIVIALCAGFLGDLFLLKVDETNYFMIGLSCFLIGHIFYISSILKNAQWNIVQYVNIQSRADNHWTSSLSDDLSLQFALGPKIQKS